MRAIICLDSMRALKCNFCCDFNLFAMFRQQVLQTGRERAQDTLIGSPTNKVYISSKIAFNEAFNAHCMRISLSVLLCRWLRHCCL